MLPIQWVEARVVHRTALRTKSYSAPNVSNPKVEKPLYRPKDDRYYQKARLPSLQDRNQSSHGSHLPELCLGKEA